MNKLPKIKSMKDMIVTFKVDNAVLTPTDFLDLISIEVDDRALSVSEIINGAKAMEYRHSKAAQDKAIRELLKSGELTISVPETNELEPA